MIIDNWHIPPGPKGRPLLGILPELRRDPVGFLTQCHQEFGGIVLYPVPGRRLYSICDPLLIEEVVVNQFTRFTKGLRKKGKPFGLQLLLGKGLLTNLDHDSWLSQRRMMQPIFHRRNIESMAGQMVAAGEAMLQRWDGLPNGAVLVLEEEMGNVALDVVSRTLFSSEAPEIARGVRAFAIDAMNYVISREMSPVRLPPIIPTPAQRRYTRAKARLDKIIYRFIEGRRALTEGHGDLLDMLLSAQDEDTGAHMSDQQVRDEAATILGAGYETTAVMLTWAWHCLNQNPKVLARLQKEVDEVLGDHLPELDDLPNLRYTLAVLKETLRRFPPGPILPRAAMQDLQLGEYHIPADAAVLIAVHAVHHDPHLWDDPFTFNPGRFIHEDHESRHRMAYIPFNAGPRMCIGERFGLMEGTFILAMMARYAEFRQVVPGPVGHHSRVTMRPVSGLPVTLQRR